MTIDLTERQLRALAFAVGEARLRLTADCGYTETEVEDLRQAVSGTQPQEERAYHYFVSYACLGTLQESGWGFGHVCIVYKHQIRTQEDLSEVRDYIESTGLQPRDVCILNFALLP